MDENEKVKRANGVKRKYKRKDIIMMVQMENILGLVENISPGGMRIVPDAFPDRITNVHISFKNKNDKLFELSGNVVWFKGIGQDKYRIGVEFNKLIDKFDKEFSSDQK